MIDSLWENEWVVWLAELENESSCLRQLTRKRIRWRFSVYPFGTSGAAVPGSTAVTFRPVGNFRYLILTDS